MRKMTAIAKKSRVVYVILESAFKLFVYTPLLSIAMATHI
jgi:hypothetical protein